MSDVQKEYESDVIKLREMASSIRLKSSESNSRRQQLEKENFSLTAWLGDSVFRTDNPERKKQAISTLKTLSDSLDACASKTDALANDLSLIVDLLRVYNEWVASVKNLFHVITLQISVPNYSTAKFQLGAELGAAVMGAVLTRTINKALQLRRFSAKLGSFLGVTIALEFIAAIFVAEDRKKAFEAIKKEADTAISKTNDASKELDEFQAGVNSLFKDLELVFKTAGAEVPDSSRTALLNAVKAQYVLIVKWNSAYTTLRALVEEDGMLLARAARIATRSLSEEGQEQEKLTKLLQGAYMLEKGESSESIAAALEVSHEQVRRMRAVGMLAMKKAPSLIAKELGMLDADVIAIQESHGKSIDNLSEIGRTAGHSHYNPLK